MTLKLSVNLDEELDVTINRGVFMNHVFCKEIVKLVGTLHMECQLCLMSDDTYQVRHIRLADGHTIYRKGIKDLNVAMIAFDEVLNPSAIH